MVFEIKQNKLHISGVACSYAPFEYVMNKQLKLVSIIGNSCLPHTHDHPVCYLRALVSQLDVFN